MTKFNPESFPMRVFRCLGLDSIAWALRHYYVPVKQSDLVLEVGSGGNPYPRSNILVDAYENTQERHWAPLITDRKTVIAFGEQLPFRDKTFDFVIGAHVLEHSADPEQFLRELQRVAKAGYIEVPHAFMERIIPYNDHRLEVYVEDHSLKVFIKPEALVDSDLRRLFLNQPNRVFSRFLISKKPFDFHVRFYWQNKIDFEILNPEQKSDWEPKPVKYHPEGLITKLRSSLRLVIL
jgi:SAM-dependent methyltransferase